jgi:hypothetical protein
MPDGSYIAQQLGGALIYGGYVTHWWGPGWVSALSLSNNARPFPQIGIQRLNTAPFKSPWLSWIGPWQAEFFFGWLDDSRYVTNTLYDGLRITVNPLPGLEIGIARTQQVCGAGNECNPLVEYFQFTNEPGHANKTNDQGEFDIRYTNRIGQFPFEVYTQFMNEDSSPITHSATSHLFGASTWIPFGDNVTRLTVEYTDTVPTRDIFSFGDFLYGAAYNNSGYRTGMRYRGRSLGFSLDSDSRLLTAQMSWTGRHDESITLSYHHVQIASNESSGINVVTAAPVDFSMGVARFTVPLRAVTIDLEGRLQGDQPRPRHGLAATVELGLRVNL